MMKKYQDNLINAWKSFDFKDAPYVLKGDNLTNKNICIYRNYNEYINDKNFGFDENRENRLHIGLLPIPYVGNLEKAKIFILMLNPGFNISDYYSYSYSKDFRKATMANLRQEINDYPLFFLSPQYLWTGGGLYWVNKFKDIMSEFKNRKFEYCDSLRNLSQNIALLELVPYRSERFGLSETLIRGLSSTMVMKNYVDKYLVPKAKEGKISIVVIRGNKYWKLQENKENNIIVYDRYESRAASLSKNSRGGKFIIEKLFS